MKFFVKKVQRFAALVAISAVVVLSSAAFGQTIQENMAAQLKQHAKPGKHIKAKGPNYEFCEVAPIMGISPENAVANFYNPTGIDHCSPEQFAQIVKDKEKIIKETGAIDVMLNPSRHWTWDEITIYVVGDERQFGPVKFLWMAAVPAEAMKKAVGEGHYHPGQITRQNTYLYKKGSRVYLIDMGEGKVLLMQSWTNFVNKDETADNLKDLGSQFKELPAGWTFRTKILDRDLTVTPPVPDHKAWVTQDEFQNTYEGCGYDAACNYTP